MESVQTQQERDRQTRLERRRQQGRERRARETPEERDRRFETRETGKEDGLDVLLRHRKKEMEDWKEIGSEVGSGAYCFK